MKTLLIALILGLLSFTAQASEPPQVMLFGTFHFKDPGKDVVKVEGINVFATEAQAYLEQLTDRLAGFIPTRVLLEYDPQNEEVMNQRYREFLDGNFELPANEIYQLGFRIAKKAGLERVSSFDHRQVPWQAEAMFDYAKAHDSPEMIAFNEIISAFTEEENAARASMDLRGLLGRSNNAELDRKNMDLYLATNSIGAGDGYAGADATASWWHRNFRMYANIQQHALPGEKVIAIGGSGHMAILKQLMAVDTRLQAVAAEPFL
jgi:hypothetical protein